MTRRWNTRAAALMLLVSLATPVLAVDEEPWKIEWSNGFKLESADKKFKLKFGGRMQADWTFVADQSAANQALYGPLADGNEFRRARLFFQGTIYGNVAFKAQYDFAGGDPEFKDVWVEFRKTPIGSIRIGHFKEPFSIEELTSSKYIAFLERSLNSMFAPGRNTGVMLHGNAARKRVHWAAGLFRESDDFGETSDASRGKLNLTARVSALPWYEDGGRRLLHLGLSATQKDLGADTFRYRTRPEVHQSPRFVDTAGFSADQTRIWDLEAAVVLGRVWAAAEYTVAESDSVAFAADDPTFDGGYVQVGCFLTDDRRRYKTSSGTFDRMKPGKNFGEGGGIGAWEVAVRYSAADLSDALPNDPLAGELEDVSLGLNWYPNPATRVMLDYVMAGPDLEAADAGSADFVTLRVQLDF